MKINKFKKNKISKFRNTKLYKGLVVGTCALTLATTLAGCGEKRPVLKDTILDSSVVATVNGDKEILRNVHLYQSEHIVKENIEYKEHDHYVNIITGEYITTDYCCKSINKGNANWADPRLVNITDVESITNYLTEEEYKKALEGNFTKDDALKVLLRIKKLPVETEEVETQKSR